MRILSASLGLMLLGSLFIACTNAAAQEASSPAAIEAVPMPVQATVNAVTIYQGRASVTRSASLHLEQGLFELRFENLPESIQPQTLQARASGTGNAGVVGPKVISVDFAAEPVTITTNPALVELDGRIETLHRSLKDVEEQRGLIKSQEDLLTSIGTKIAADTAKDAGSPGLDVKALQAQIAFTADERGRLLKSRRDLDVQQLDLDKKLKQANEQRTALAGASSVNRVASVTVASPQSGPCTIDLTYLVAQATWQPAYSVRAMLDGSQATIEYDALLTQRTGEDWDNVKLTLSTAQPTVAANPPVIQPWYLDIRQPMLRTRAGLEVEAASTPPAPSMAPGRAMTPSDQAGEDRRAMLEELSADASVGGGGPSVTFELPRTVTVKTNATKQQRTRIAAIDTNPQFIHVASPVLTEAVYVRGELTNASAYQLLPGPAAIFVGQDYVGPTAMESVPPGSQFKIHFGIDQSVKARRQLVSKVTESTGLLGGGLRTAYDYRINIDNASGKAITLEMWDRHPISRHEDIQVVLRDLSDPLDADARYVADQQPQGLMKWWLHIPAGATGQNAKVITYGVRIDRAKDVEMTELPE